MPNYASHKRQPPKTPASPRRLIVVGLITLVGLLSIVNIILSAHLSDLGLRLQALKQESEALSLANQQLEQTILAKSALTKIQARAREIGYSREYQALSLPVSQPVAYHQD